LTILGLLYAEWQPEALHPLRVNLLTAAEAHLESLDVPMSVIAPLAAEGVDAPPATLAPLSAFGVETPRMIDPDALASAEELATTFELSDFGGFDFRTIDAIVFPPGHQRGNPFGHRSAAERARLLRLNQGNILCEGAVARALKWLALHQRADGGFSFDHRHGPCQSNPGSLADATHGATGLALLPFLGAGYTHREGTYQRPVRGGLAYLVRNMKWREGKYGDLSDSGALYSHGIAAIALCEAYGMTNDKELRAPAQGAIHYLQWAQDPVGGGWRYRPRQPGDTSVVGWQLMALKSAHMAYLDVSPDAVRGTSRFLDSVQTQAGDGYGYTAPGNGEATTAVGLLCRMYLGAKRDDEALQRGVARLSKLGPSETNLYYNYYGTQALLHYGGDAWRQWNDVQRDRLLETQAREGTEAGSWYSAGDHGSERGGRLYCTALSTLLLEVYYRHLPIYGAAAVEDDFPL
jgi:hypothetical protein